MLLNLEKLCTNTIIAYFAEKNFETDMNVFTEQLNNNIHGWGSIGYDEAEKFNLKITSKYTVEDSKNLASQIIQTRKLSKYDLFIAQIEEIPVGIAKELAEESAGGANFVVTESRNTQIKLGLIHGYELVGFVSANIKNKGINLGGIYIREDYRKKGFSKKLLMPLLNKAKKEDLIGIFAHNASWDGIDALRFFERYCKKNGETDIEFYTDEDNAEELSKYATVYFKNKYNSD